MKIGAFLLFKYPVLVMFVSDLHCYTDSAGEGQMLYTRCCDGL